VPGEQVSDGVGAEPPAGAGGEQRVGGLAVAFAEPVREDPRGGPGQWGASLFASFAVASEVRAGAEGDIAAVHPG
jgi:hypothetical protein